MTPVAVSLLLMVSCLIATSLASRPPYIECQTTSECGKDSCCVVGMGRYSIPTCKPKQQLGQKCRLYGEAANTTLYYPDGSSLDLWNVHYILCPCQEGLTCVEDSSGVSQCGEPFLSNQLYDYEDNDDSAQRPRS